MRSLTQPRSVKSHCIQTLWIQPLWLVVFALVLSQAIPLPNAFAKENDKSTRKKSVLSYEINGRVVDADENPVADAEVTAHIFKSEVLTTTTDSKGKFQFLFDTRLQQQLPVRAIQANGKNGTLGEIPGTLIYGKILREAKEATEDRCVVSTDDLQLQPPRHLEVAVVNQQNNPVKGVKVTALSRFHLYPSSETNEKGKATLTVPAQASLSCIIAAAETGVDYAIFAHPQATSSNPYQLKQDHNETIPLTLNPTYEVTVKVVDAEGTPVANAQVAPWLLELPKHGGNANLGLLWQTPTDLKGVAQFPSIPKQNLHPITFWVRKQGFSSTERTTLNLASGATEATATLLPEVPAEGIVTWPDGTPASGVAVRTRGTGYSMDSFREAQTTDDEGKFHFQLAPNKYYSFAAVGKKEAAEEGDLDEHFVSPMAARVVLTESPEPLAIQLELATRVLGKVTLPDGKPLAKQFVSLNRRSEENRKAYSPAKSLPNLKGSNQYVDSALSSGTQTDEEGRYEFFTGRGQHSLYLPSSNASEAFDVKDASEKEFDFQLEVDPNAKLRGRVVLASDSSQGIAGVSIMGRAKNVHGNLIQATSGENGYFEHKSSQDELLIGAHTSDDKLGCITTLKKGQEEITMELAPTATLRGKLVNQETSEPIANKELTASIKIKFDIYSTNAFGGKATTDESGGFEISGLTPGFEYEIRAVVNYGPEGYANSFRQVGTTHPDKAEIVELGKLTYKLDYSDLLQENFVGEELIERLEQAKQDQQAVLLVVGNANCQEVQEFFQTYYGKEVEHKRIQELLQSHVVIGAHPDQAKSLEAYGIYHVPRKASLYLLDPSGQMIGNLWIEGLMKNYSLNNRMLEAFLKMHTGNLQLQ